MASLLEQLTNNGPLPIAAFGLAVVIGSVITYVFLSRLLSSSSKSKTTTSKQSAKKEKESSGKKQQQDATSGKNKTANNKNKKNTSSQQAAAVKNNVSTTSSSSESDETEEEEKQQPTLAQSTKKVIASSKGATGKKVGANEETNKSNAAKVTGASSVKQQQVPTKKEVADTLPSADAKKKQTKPNGTVQNTVSNKNQSKGKEETNTKSTSIKKQGASVDLDAKRALADDNQNEPVVDQDDEGQWVTQSSKQVNNRNRNKVKGETSSPNNQEPVTSSGSSRKTGTEKRSPVAVPSTESAQLSSTADSHTETSAETTVNVVPIPAPEPIKICQLLPTRENPYTASDDWWKHALNIKQNFTVDDIGDWPEREVDEQYVKIESIVPPRVAKSALTEKDINVGIDGHSAQNQNSSSQRRAGKLDRDDEKKFDDQKNGTNVNSNESTTGTSQSKKKANVRRIS